MYDDDDDHETWICPPSVVAKQALDDFWNMHVPDSLYTMFRQVAIHEPTEHDNDDDAETPSSVEPDEESVHDKIAVVLRRHTPPQDLISLLKILIQTRDESSVVSLTLHKSPYTWLLPTFLSLLPNLERFAWRDPVLETSGVRPKDVWSRAYDSLKDKKHLRSVFMKWKTTVSLDETFVPDDAWLHTLLQLPHLQEYHQEGQSPIPSQRWTRVQVMRLLYHETLQVLYLSCPLEADSFWPSRTLLSLWRLPKRNNPLRLMLPSLSDKERRLLVPILPHYVHLLAEEPIVAVRLSNPSSCTPPLDQVTASNGNNQTMHEESEMQCHSDDDDDDVDDNVDMEES